MRAIHILLGASLLANGLAVAGYLYTRDKIDRGSAPVAGATLVVALGLTPEQTKHLAEMQQSLRAELQGLRAQTTNLFDIALAKVRDARPGDTSYESALQATGDVRRRQTAIITRELIAFREHLSPAQRETFNLHLGEWAFIEALMGLTPDSARTMPSGPFRVMPAAPVKNGR